MPIIDLNTNLNPEHISVGLQSRFANHFASLWGKETNVRINFLLI